jgi:Glucose / Sorbosone dehydrogenase
VNDERGLLGLAFHPDYANQGTAGYRKLYTFGSELVPVGGSSTYGTPNGAITNFQMVINEWTRDANNPNVIDPNSRREVFSYSKNASNHNGGTIAFGPDGYLYLGTGDGGNSYDAGGATGGPANNSHAIVNGNFATQGNALNLTNPMGKMLRIDPIPTGSKPGSVDQVSTNGQYRIPSNPFTGAGELREIYAYGLRNPYRFAFDDRPGGTGDLIAADVGQGNIEEINRIVPGGNYGWVNREGTFNIVRQFNPDGTLVTLNSTNNPDGYGYLIPTNSPEPLNNPLTIDPIRGTEIDPETGLNRYLQYDHQDGLSITGGFVYRGSFLPELEGKYIFADLSLRNSAQGRIDGRLFYADLVTGKMEEFVLPQFATGYVENQTVHGFGQDGNGELYVFTTATGAASGGTGGLIYAITGVPEPSSMLLCFVGVGMAATIRRRRIALTSQSSPRI